MTIERARRQAMHRPWGVADPGDWGVAPAVEGTTGPIGEIWYDRPGQVEREPALLLKVLLTSAPLSIQVHPDDEHARSIGLPNGKSEAWHVLSAEPNAKIALGLNQTLTPHELGNAARDGSIEQSVSWRNVVTDDTIMVPAGTIHAIGAGLIIAEIQQRSDTTFRLFDHGRARELHVESAVSASILEPAKPQTPPVRMSAQRTLLTGDHHFVLERLELPADTTWQLKAEQETWLLVLDGSAAVGVMDIAKADAVFAQSDELTIAAGGSGLVGLLAYTGNSPIPGLLRRSASRPVAGESTQSSPRSSRPTASAIHPAAPQRLQRIALIGNHLPRRCGIATFTHDLHQAVAAARPDLKTSVVAMNDTGRSYEYPGSVEIEIAENTIDSYVRAAAILNRGDVDVVSLQHEFGIFGGMAGGHIVELLKRLAMPVVTTLHTVLAKPSPEQRGVMTEIVARSARLVVMAEKGRELLQSVYGVPARRIEVIPHGIPDVPFRGTDEAKAKLGFSGKTVILTFGLLSPSKGIESVIDAMPHIVRSCPSAVYVVLGASHPNLVRQSGESYRESLQSRVGDLGLDGKVVFIDQFVDQATLLDFIAMCDVYVTPYRNEAQMTSGTLAYSYGLGKAVVSTPYWHASELLADGRGILVPFDDTLSMASEIAGLLTDPSRRDVMRARAYADSRSMTWARTAATYLATFDAVDAGNRSASTTLPARRASQSPSWTLPDIETGHFLSMCDSTGLLQHAIHSIPDRSHGYCVDDNARALLFSLALVKSGEEQISTTLTARFAAFVQHAWNQDTRRFRNFMSYDRRWLEAQGSEDSHGRTLWALGECSNTDPDASRRQWAAALFEQALPTVEAFSSPRAWAFTLLGIDAYCTRLPDNPACLRMRGILAEKLLAALSAVETEQWVWFEDELAYDNARLPQALIATGQATGNQALVDAGTRALRWLMTIQTAAGGTFRPVGTESFGKPRRQPLAFDQQPVESAATISACLAAWQVSPRAEWMTGASAAFAWFLGRNDLATPLVDTETGRCRDGLHPDRANENCGAESVLSYLTGLAELRQFTRTASIEHKVLAVDRAGGIRSQIIISGPIPGGYVDTIPVLEPPDAASPARPHSGRRQTVQARDGTSRPQPD